MKSKEFVGVVGVNKATPTGGSVAVAFGNIITEDEQKLEAIAIQIKDHEGGTVCEFALQPETFGIMIEAIKELYDGVLPNDESV